MQCCKRTILLAFVAMAALTQAVAGQTTLRYQFKEGDKVSYVMEQKMKMAMSIMGKDIDTKMNMSMEMSWNVLKVDAQGNAQLQIKVVHAKMSMDGPTGLVEVDSKDKNEPKENDQIGKIFGQVIKALASMEMNGTMMHTGEVKDLKVSEETLKALKSLPGADKLGDVFSPDNFKTMISNLVFPTDAVVKGKTWTNKTETKTPIGKTVTETTFTYDGPAEKDGVTLVKIGVKPAIKIDPDPNAPIEIKLKDVKASGHIYFDNKIGRLIETYGTQRMEMQIGAQGLNLSQIIDQTVTLRLKK